MNKIMKVKIIIISLFLIGGIAGLFGFYKIVDAKIDASFPIQELGNCENETACRAFCEKHENIIPCINFAEKQGLVSPDEAKKAKAFAKSGEGPGNCKTQKECEEYCANPGHQDACLTFAAEHGLISEKEYQDARMVTKVLKAGGQLPGGCKNRAECENYCSDTSRADECLGFAEKAGLMSPEEIKEAQMALKAILSGIKPPGNCQNKKQCDAYCKDSSHIEECLGFAEKAGFVSAKEAAEAKKMLPLIAKGETPGGCKTKKECEAFCDLPENSDSCLSFAEKTGLISKEEAEMARKTGGKGPGGCRSKQACEEFCNKVENQNECFKFAEKYDLITPDKLAAIKEGMGRVRAGLAQAPEEVVNCLKTNLGEDIISKIESGDFMPSQQMGNQMKNCFEKFVSETKQKIQEVLSQAPPEVMQCLEKKLGAENLNKIKAGEAPTPELGAKMKSCFDEFTAAKKKEVEKALADIKKALGTVPKEVRDCFASKVGKSTLEKIEAGESVEVTSAMGNALKQCAESFKPKMAPIPTEVTDCVEEIYGSAAAKQLLTGQWILTAERNARVVECIKKKKMPQIP